LLDKATDCGCPDGLHAVGTLCSSSIFGGASGADLLGGTVTNESNGNDAASTSNALSCCCLPAALIGIVGGFAFIRKD